MKLELKSSVERWPLRSPFRTSIRYVEYVDLLVVELKSDHYIGRGEAAGVHYRSETAQTLKLRLDALRPVIEARLTSEQIQSLLPPGGARNALDCAFWDLEAKRASTPVWELAGLPAPSPVPTDVTCSADTPDRMASIAAEEGRTNSLKLKLIGDGQDADRVRAVRSARPNAWMSVDANQALTPQSLDELMPVLVECNISLIEQPFAIGKEKMLEGYASPIPIVGDESIHISRDIPAAVGRYSWINIKLDKCGGLSEALKMRRIAADLGISVTVGNMIGTSLAMAPAYLVAQGCSISDLDGPIFLLEDRPYHVEYSEGFIRCPDTVWGGA